MVDCFGQVTFQLQPLFKRSLTWYPSQKLVVYRRDNRVPTNTSGNGVYDFIGFRSTSSAAISTLRIAGILFKGYPVVGYHNRLQSSGSCLVGPEDNLRTACPWDPRIKGFFFHQTTFSIALSSVQSFIRDIQELVRLAPQSLCGLDSYSGILMRYVTASSAYLGKEEDALDFDLTYYRNKDPLQPRMFEDVLAEIEQMAVFKYGALPHWGKNRNVAFIGAIEKFKNREKFLDVKQQYDPKGLFSSEWTDQILGLKGGLGDAMTAGCAIEGLCICSVDAHCAPANGYRCRPGRVYTEARVCRKDAK